MNKILITKNRIFIILIIFAVISSILTAMDGGDFDVFLDAANKLKDHSNIYSPPFVKGLQYYYSVFFAWFLMPFSNQIFITEILWMLVSYLLLYRAFTLSLVYFDISSLTEKQYRLWVFFTVFFSLQLFHPHYYQYHHHFDDIVYWHLMSYLNDDFITTNTFIKYTNTYVHINRINSK